jgi:arginyl-tRNA synthetase
MKEKIVNEIKDTLKRLYASNDVISKINIEVNKTSDSSHGDLYTNIAMKLAKILKKQPTLIAKEIVNNLQEISDIDKIDLAHPGYINFFLTKSNKYYELERIIKNNLTFSKVKDKKNIHIEYVSANPTGPLHIGHGRGMIVGDTTARFMSLIGHNVTREYYVNDAGRQIDLLLVSALLCHLNMKDHIFIDEKNNSEGRLVTYKGSYVNDVSESIKFNLQKINKEDVSALLDGPIDELITYIKNTDDYFNIRKSLVDEIIESYIKKDLSSVNIKFDSWFNESDLYKSGLLKTVLEEIDNNNLSYTKDGALWFKNTHFGETKDRVLIKSNGDMTYFATDIAYHVHKFKNHDILINIWGADHHDYAIRLTNAMKSLGYDVKNRLHIHLVQFANLIMSGKSISMSTRSGDFYPIQDLVKEIGSDATKYFYLTKKKDQHLEFDVDLAIKKNKNNPIYYIQYAHARITKIINDLENTIIEKDKFNNLNSRNEIELIELINNSQDIIDKAISTIRPDIITNHLYKLAQTFHSYYGETKILTTPIRGEKVTLIRCIDKVLVSGLELLEIKPMDRM